MQHASSIRESVNVLNIYFEEDTLGKVTAPSLVSPPVDKYSVNPQMFCI